MKKNHLIFILVFSFVLLFSRPVLADFSYTRTPPDYTISGIINFSGSITREGDWYWKLAYQKPAALVLFGSCNAPSTLTFNENINLPIGEYTLILLKWFEAADCSGVARGTHWFEGNGESVIFEVIPTPAIFGYPSNFNTNFAASVFGFASETLFDLRIVFYILVGLALGMGIILFILDLFEDRKTK